MSLNDQQTSNWWIGVAYAKKNYMQNAKCNFRLPLKLKFLNTRCTSTCISHIFRIFHESRKQSHFIELKPLANATIMWKKASLRAKSS